MLENVFDKALADRPAPPTELTKGQHRYHLVMSFEPDALGDKLAELRADGVKVLDYKRKNAFDRWVIKSMVPRT